MNFPVFTMCSSGCQQLSPLCYTSSMTRDDFEELIRQAINAIPPKVGARLDNVAFVVENTRPRRAGEHGIRGSGFLLGLYQGVPLGSRGPQYNLALPDKITIFQDAIELVGGGDPIKTRQQVFDTVHHEIAHYLGLSEREVRVWERKRRS